MITIYDLLEIEENASKEEIDNAYARMIHTYRQDPSFSDEKNKENEMIMNKLKIAYGILSDESKRKKYDSDLSKKRAENLLKNINQSPEKSDESKKEEVQNIEPKKKKMPKKREQYDFDDGDVHKYDDEMLDDDVELTKEEQDKLHKAAKQEFKKNLIKAQKAEEEYKRAYEEAYNDYMRKNKYVSNKSMTLRKFITIFVSIVVIILVFFIAIHLPPVKRALNTLYEENEVIRIIVDIIKSILGIS